MPRKVCYPLPCMQAAVVIHRMLWKRVCYPCAAMHASCCHDPQNALVEEGCATPALPQARCLIHRMLCRRRVLSPAVMHASCCHDPQNAPGKWVCILRCHASSLLSDSECSGARKGVIPALLLRLSTRMSGGRRVCYPCAAMQARCCMIHRMLWWKKCAIPCAAMQAAVVIHRMLVEEGCAIPCAAMHARHDPHRMPGGKVGVLSLRHKLRCCDHRIVQGGVLSPC
jgi:hypothetical protein